MKKPWLGNGGKLLVASVGVATVNYVVACKDDAAEYPVTGNLPAPPPPSAIESATAAPTAEELPPIVGNLPAPPPPNPTATASAAPPPPITGNLPAPPPPPAPGASAQPVAPATKPK